MTDDAEPTPIQVRTYGQSGPTVLLLHGGPGAPGGMAPVARTLADSFHVLEPLQRGSHDEPLSVACHVADLHQVIASHCNGAHPALVGHSWGAMLALAYAAEHPDRASALALVGCGTFDTKARARLHEICAERMTPDIKQRLDRLEEEVPDPNERLKTMGELLKPVYSFDPLPDADTGMTCDLRAHEETWADMVRLQEQGVYPAAFSAIREPVVMLHGAYDPHPGTMIRDGLKDLMPQLEYREWPRCGHAPWLEKEASDAFYTFLREWLLHQCA